MNTAKNIIVCTAPWVIHALDAQITIGTLIHADQMVDAEGREPMGKLTDLDAVLDILHLDPGIATEQERMIKELPEAVIRCRDCKYCKTYDDIPWCDRLTGTFRVEEESFCSFGKRRTE